MLSRWTNQLEAHTPIETENSSGKLSKQVGRDERQLKMMLQNEFLFSTLEFEFLV